ncbi:Uncharacterised protein [Bordetella pertussis]|nr:Uncharacterised protein [Bordetella pertussis]CFN06263.1 Uncharacterised protein [Bordetella pertussis]CFN24499.1 Uncharacterised protein [Bordetella pertussis]CFN60590.1 Uncharacterised protein [Bordetella pertussis]CFN81971.1 Uncharacterised protein [Bordetella pertussis]
MLLTPAWLNDTCSFKARLSDWITLPCNWWRTPSGLTVMPVSWPTTTRSTVMAPLRASTARSTTQAAQAAPKPGNLLCT